MRHLRVSRDRLHGAFVGRTPAVLTSGPVSLLALLVIAAPSGQMHLVDRHQVLTNYWVQAIASLEVPREERLTPATIRGHPEVPVFQKQRVMSPAVRHSAKPEVAAPRHTA